MDDRPTRTPQTAQVVQSPPRREAKAADPCAMVIFGATGDLTKRLVIPASITSPAPKCCRSTLR
jgi:glucose-6-phosphate 1-dehydrogenase